MNQIPSMLNWKKLQEVAAQQKAAETPKEREDRLKAEKEIAAQDAIEAKKEEERKLAAENNARTSGNRHNVGQND